MCIIVPSLLEFFLELLCSEFLRALFIPPMLLFALKIVIPFRQSSVVVRQWDPIARRPATHQTLMTATRISVLVRLKTEFAMLVFAIPKVHGNTPVNVSRCGLLAPGRC